MPRDSESGGKWRLTKRLFEIGVETLEKQGWRVERVPGAGRSSLRRVAKDSESKRVTIKTTQDKWVAFGRTKDDSEWATLSESDFVVVVSVDDVDRPRFAQVHLIDGDEMRNRFDRAYRARLDAGHMDPARHGMWVSLYDDEADGRVNRVGAGAGVANPAILRVPLDERRSEEEIQSAGRDGPPSADESLTIAEAKRRLAATFGVSPSSVRITIEE